MLPSKKPVPSSLPHPSSQNLYSYQSDSNYDTDEDDVEQSKQTEKYAHVFGRLEEDDTTINSNHSHTTNQFVTIGFIGQPNAGREKKK